MSGESFRKITSRSYKHVILGGLSLVGCTSLASYGYYKRVYEPAKHRAAAMAGVPVRRTKLYVAGTQNGEGLLPEPKVMPTPVFYVYVAYRIALLFIGCIPVAWYAFLTYALRLCSEPIFHDKIRTFLLSMGPSYIKLGQWMATRPDFFPSELCLALEKLYDKTDPHSWAHTEKLLRMKYTDEGKCDGKNTLFYLSEIEKVPINSGSIAQVHRATLRESVDGLPAGTELALKVTHPYIRERVAADVAAMRLFVWAATRLVPTLRFFNLDVSVEEFSSLIRSQLNLLVECDNIMQFRYNFRNFSGVVFPTPLPSLCTEDVLVETFEDGQPLQDVECSRDNDDIAELGCHMFLKMLFKDNFAHSDLHPGNLFLRRNNFPNGVKVYYPDGKQKLERELVVLDAGLVTTLSKTERNNFISLFAAVASGDGELGADLMLDRLPEHMKGGEGVNRERFRAEMKEIFDLVAPGTEGFKLSNIKMGTILGMVMNTVRENNAPLDGNFASLVLTVIVGEGLGRRLTPDFNIFAEAAPYLVAFLEDSELFFLASKLRNAYGTTALLRDSVDLVKPYKVTTYAEVAFTKAESLACKLFQKQEG